MPYRTGYVSKGREHTHITGLRSGSRNEAWNGTISGDVFMIPGYCIIIPGHCIINPGHCIISPGHCIGFLRYWRVTGWNMRGLVAMWIVNPQETTLM